MRVRRFEWKGAGETARVARRWAEEETLEEVDATLNTIERDVRRRGDEAVLELTRKFDATRRPPEALRVSQDALDKALATTDASLIESLKLAAANIRKVAKALIDGKESVIELPQGQTVAVREVPVAAAGIYAPGGLAAYPSSVLMCAIPAQVAGVERIALASPPNPDGEVHQAVLAAAALCGIDEVYAMGGAQAVFALAHGTQTVKRVDVIAGPGNNWVQEAKKKAFGFAGIDSYAGPSELMLIAGPDTNADWAALDLCAQVEHGGGGPLLLAAVETSVIEAIDLKTRQVAERIEADDVPLALVQVPTIEEAVQLANAYCPEHLELLAQAARPLTAEIRTAGCVLVGPHSATAFSDYVAGSNHVLPTLGAGRFSGALGPHVFRRKIATVEVSAEAAAKLAPHVKTLAEAEGFPVHGESAMIRAKDA